MRHDKRRQKYFCGLDLMGSHRQESKAAVVCSARRTLIGSLSNKKKTKLRTEYSSLEDTHLSGKTVWSSVLFFTPRFLENKKMTFSSSD